MILKDHLYNLVNEDHKESKVSRYVNLFITLLILLNVLAIILESFSSIRDVYEVRLYQFEVFSVSVFTIEYILRLITANLKYPDKNLPRSIFVFIFSPVGLIDLFAILPFYLPLFFAMDLRFIRILRLLRVMRILKLNRYSKSLKMIGDVVREKRAELSITLFVVFILLILASTLIYYVESKLQPDAFPNILAAFWWAVATLTGLGVDDLAPNTGLGKLISGLIALLGIGVIALPTGILSAAFMDKLEKSKEDKEKPCPHCGKLPDIKI